MNFSVAHKKRELRLHRAVTVTRRTLKEKHDFDVKLFKRCAKRAYVDMNRFEDYDFKVQYQENSYFFV